MNCDKIQEQLSDYLDDVLSPAERSIVDTHLGSCPNCRKALDDLEMTVRSIRGLDDITPPSWLTQKIMTSVKAEAESKKRSLLQKLFYPLHIKLPIEAVGIFLVALTALYVFKNIEPEFKKTMPPSEETVSEYAAKEKSRKPGPSVKEPSQSPAITRSKTDERVAVAPAPLSEQTMYDKEPPAREKRLEMQKAPEKEMVLKSAPSPAGRSAHDELKQESAQQAAGKIVSGLSEKEDISLSFKARDMASAKRELKETLSDLGGKVVREEPTSDALIVIGELGSDKLLPFMQRVKSLGYVKEQTPTPMSDKDRVLIKITVSRH